MIIKAEQINNRHYERTLKGKGFYDVGHLRRGTFWKNNYYRPQPIELDAIVKKEMSP
jgi:hypothetical protein